MKNNLTTKQKRHDVMLFAASPKTREKPYHISGREYMVLEQMFRYDNANPNISYSNPNIERHMMLGDRQVEPIIPSLVKKGFISSTLIPISIGHNQMKKKRVIRIKWDFIDFLYGECEAYREGEKNPVSDKEIEVPMMPSAIPEEEKTIKSNESIAEVANNPAPMTLEEFRPICHKINPRLTEERIQEYYIFLKGYDLSFGMKEIESLLGEKK